MRKTPPQFMCSVCNTKTTMLNRMFGTWPLPEFRDLQPDVQQSFWQSRANDKEALKRSVQDILVSRLVETELAKQEGPFLPLSVWASQGYNVQDIAARAKNKEHPVLGLTYQVKIKTTGEERKRELIQEQMLKLLNRKVKMEPEATGQDDEEQASQPKTSSGSSDSSSSSEKKKQVILRNTLTLHRLSGEMMR